MKTVEHLDKYVMIPNVDFCGGFVYNGEDIFLCDDRDEQEGYICNVKQMIKDNVLYTELEREYTLFNKDKKVKEKSTMEVEIEKGQLLVYVVGTGYTIPERALCKVEEAIGYYDILRGGNNDVCGNEKESS